jgi:hypothetical protein
VPCILDAPNPAFTSSGRAAIALALENPGIGAGDAVLVPTYHCPTMIAPIVASGATPLFFPIDGDGRPALDVIATFDLSRVRAMSAVHYFGFQDRWPVRRFCGRARISLIEDCAHAMFGRSDEAASARSAIMRSPVLTNCFSGRDGGCLVSHDLTDQRDVVAPAEGCRSGEKRGECGDRNRRDLSRDAGCSIWALEALFAATNAVPARRNITAANGAPTRASGATHNGNGTDTASRASRVVALDCARRRARTNRRIAPAQLRSIWRRCSRAFPARVLHPALPQGVVPYVFPLWSRRRRTSIHACELREYRCSDGMLSGPVCRNWRTISDATGRFGCSSSPAIRT